MTRMLTLHHKTAKKLLSMKMAAERDGEYRVAKRIHAVLLNHDGYTSGGIARLLHSPRSRVSDWLKNYESLGYEALLEGCRSGRPTRLSAEQRRRLCHIIDSGPTAYNYLGGVWTASMIQRVIKEECSISYHVAHVRKILYSLNYSLQRPRRLLVNADPVRQSKWRRHTYPNIKKKLRRLDRQ